MANGEKGCANIRRRSKAKAIVSSLNTINECEIENGNRKMNGNPRIEIYSTYVCVNSRHIGRLATGNVLLVSERCCNGLTQQLRIIRRHQDMKWTRFRLPTDNACHITCIHGIALDSRHLSIMWDPLNCKLWQLSFSSQMTSRLVKVHYPYVYVCM